MREGGSNCATVRPERSLFLESSGRVLKNDNGDVSSRKDVVNALENAGFDVVRQVAKSISISDPDGGRNIRLKGLIYEQDFKFGAGLREEIESASARYKNESKENIQRAREVCRTGVEIKREQNNAKYRRPESSYEPINSKNMDMAGSERNDGRDGLLSGRLVAGRDNSSQLENNQGTERNTQKEGRTIGSSG